MTALERPPAWWLWTRPLMPSLDPNVLPVGGATAGWDRNAGLRRTAVVAFWASASQTAAGSGHAMFFRSTDC